MTVCWWIEVVLSLCACRNDCVLVGGGGEVLCAVGEGKSPFSCLHNLSHLPVFENIIMEVSDDLAN
jgi:hypothetical protein